MEIWSLYNSNFSKSTFNLQSGRLPIIVAAVRGKKEIVETLFPLTAPIPTMPDWSIDGLFNYVESQEYKTEVCNLALLFYLCQNLLILLFWEPSNYKDELVSFN